jgi:divinyl chlorophyllide a 8-vinyl-reductase
MVDISSHSKRARRVLVLGATGTIGRATVRALRDDGHQVVCLLRAHSPARESAAELVGRSENVCFRPCQVTNADDLQRNGLRGEQFDVLVSCMASRTGAPDDAWAIDHRATVNAIDAAKAASVTHVVLLSAICVQKPILAFQHAKLAAERAVIDSGMTYSIVRPTAYFKSVSGQIERVKRGKPYLIFGDGTLTSCKPISDDDLARYIADCLSDATRHNRILPIGGPGPALSPRDQADALFSLLCRPPRFRSVPIRLLDTIAGSLTMLARAAPSFASKAELARIGRYYATESMLVLNPTTGLYDAERTPSTGTQTLSDHFARVLRGETAVERGDHAVF